MPSSSHFRESAGKTRSEGEYGETRCAVLKHNEVESRSTFRQRRFFLRTSGYNEPLFKFSDPENLVKVFLEEHEDFLPQRQNLKCEKQQCGADFLDSSVRDLQRQLDSDRLDIHCTNQGHEESRKEQARLHEELAQRERVLQETQIRSVHEVGELKRSSGNPNRRILQERIDRKSPYRSSLHKYRSCRKECVF